MESVNRRDEIVSELRQRILSGLTLGILREGQKLPSVRATSEEFNVDPRVILWVNQKLEASGVIERRDRSGVYVARHRALKTDFAPEQADWVADVVLAGLKRGLPAASLGERLTEIFAVRPMRAVVLDCNDDQLWSLTDELKRDYGFRVMSMDLDLLSVNRRMLDQARNCDVVVTTSFHEDKVRPVAKELELPLLTVTMCTDLFAEVHRLLRHKEVFFVVADKRMARKLHLIFKGTPYSWRLRVRVLGTDTLGDIPENAPVYVTRLARRKMRKSALLDRCLPEARVFSAASARELIGFVVQNRLRDKQEARGR